MVNQLIGVRLRAGLARAALAAGALVALAPAAEAQWFGFNQGVPPGQIEQRLADSGYAMIAPLQRNGGVYVADVVGRPGDQERLVIDAGSGRLLQRFRSRPTRMAPAYAANGMYGEDPYLSSRQLVPTDPPVMAERPLTSEPLNMLGGPRVLRAQPDDRYARSEDLGRVLQVAPRTVPAAPDLVESAKPLQSKRKLHPVQPALATPAAKPPVTAALPSPAPPQPVAPATPAPLPPADKPPVTAALPSPPPAPVLSKAAPMPTAIAPAIVSPPAAVVEKPKPAAPKPAAVAVARPEPAVAQPPKPDQPAAAAKPAFIPPAPPHSAVAVQAPAPTPATPAVAKPATSEPAAKPAATSHKLNDLPVDPLD